MRTGELVPVALHPPSSFCVQNKTERVSIVGDQNLSLQTAFSRIKKDLEKLRDQNGPVGLVEGLKKKVVQTGIHLLHIFIVQT